MIRVQRLIYRMSETSHFDFDYYVDHHVALSRRLLADCGLLSIEVEKVLRRLDGEPSDIVCITHVDFEDEAGLNQALERHGGEMMADFPNYTDIAPEIQVCRILTTGR